MPIHDWARVPAGIFHAFHHDWITELARSLNRGLLPENFYALPEQQAAGFGPDVLTLHAPTGKEDAAGSGGVATIVVRHVGGDRIVAVLEVVSPGNKASEHAMRAFVEKACDLLEYRIHLLIIDPIAPGPRGPNGVHAAIWEEFQDEPFALPKDKPLTLVANDCDLTTRAYIETIAVGERLPDMPLFLEPGAHLLIPLEITYQTAFDALPRRWRGVLEK